MSEIIEEKSPASNRAFDRRYDLDWLRIIGILLVFVFHCTRFFDSTSDWHVKNDILSKTATLLVYYLGGFGMPIFFIIAGMGTFFALRFVTGKQYALSRVIRLLVPFMIGMFSHIPIQVYLERVSHGDFTGTFFEWFPQYFQGGYGYGDGNFAFLGLHLWFLAVLLVISLLLLPGAVYFSKDKNLDRLDKFTNFLNKPGILYLFPIPIILIEFVIRITGADKYIYTLGGWSILTYFVYFIYGYLFASNLKFKKTIEKHGIPALITAILTGVGLYFSFTYQVQLGETLFVVLVSLLGVFYSWSCLLALFAMGSKFLNRNNRARKFLNELVMPFYVMHQTVIVVIGFFIVQLSINYIGKYFIILSTSFAVCVLLTIIIKYINPLRFIFGMRWKKGLLRRTKKEKVIETELLSDETSNSKTYNQ